MRRAILVGLVLFGVFVSGALGSAAVMVALWPDSEPAQRVSHPLGNRRARPDATKGERAAPVEGTRARAARPNRERPGDRAGERGSAADHAFPRGPEDLTPDERMEYRQAFREERLADM